MLNQNYKFAAVPHMLTGRRLHEGNAELNYQKDRDHWVELALKECEILPPPIPS